MKKIMLTIIIIIVLVYFIFSFKEKYENVIIENELDISVSQNKKLLINPIYIPENFKIITIKYLEFLEIILYFDSDNYLKYSEYKLDSMIYNHIKQNKDEFLDFINEDIKILNEKDNYNDDNIYSIIILDFKLILTNEKTEYEIPQNFLFDGLEPFFIKDIIMLDGNKEIEDFVMELNNMIITKNENIEFNKNDKLFFYNDNYKHKNKKMNFEIYISENKTNSITTMANSTNTMVNSKTTMANSTGIFKELIMDFEKLTYKFYFIENNILKNLVIIDKNKDKSIKEFIKTEINNIETTYNNNDYSWNSYLHINEDGLQDNAIFTFGLFIYYNEYNESQNNFRIDLGYNTNPINPYYEYFVDNNNGILYKEKHCLKNEDNYGCTNIYNSNDDSIIKSKLQTYEKNNIITENKDLVVDSNADIITLNYINTDNTDNNEKIELNIYLL